MACFDGEGGAYMEDPTDDGVRHAPLRSFIGGQGSRLRNVGWPLARMDLYSDMIRLRPIARFLRVLVPTWEARFEEISEVRAIGKVDFFTTGVRFRTNRPRDFAVFWTFQRPDVLNSLEAVGLAVKRDPARFHYLNPDLDRY